MKLICLDTETTGLDPHKNALIQVAGHFVIDGVRKDGFCLHCKPMPEEVVDDAALKANGLTREQLDGYLPSKDVHNEFKRVLGRWVDKYDKLDKLHFVAYNARFDMDFMRAWFEKCGDKFFGSWFWFPPLDVMDLAAWHLRDVRRELPNFKLITVAKHLNVPLQEERLHEAGYDVEVMCAVLDRIAPNWKGEQKDVG